MRLPEKFTVDQINAIIDTREQTPFDLSPMQCERGTLQVGDYSIRGLETVVAIERKSLPDFVACCGTERDRFQRELNSLRGWQVSAVIIEAAWNELDLAQWRSRLTAKQVKASALSWIAQGHNLVFAGCHEQAAEVCKGILYYAARNRYREARALSRFVEVTK